MSQYSSKQAINRDTPKKAPLVRSHTPEENVLSSDPKQNDTTNILHLQRMVGNAAVQRMLKKETASSIQRSGEQKLDKHITITGNETITGDPFVTGKDDGGAAIHPSDADQASLGDCFLIAALAVVAQQNPELIKSAINPKKQSPDGKYTVTFYRKKAQGWTDRLFGSAPEYEKVPITVDSVFPTARYTTDDGKKIENVDAHAGTNETVAKDDGSTEIKNEMWAVIMEKAYGVFIGGGYEQLNKGGDAGAAMEALTGQPSSSKSPEEYSAEELDAKLKKGHGIILNTYGDEKKYLDNKSGLVGNHAYYLTKVDAKAKTITVRNPWGWERGELTFPVADLKKHFSSVSSNEL